MPIDIIYLICSISLLNKKENDVIDLQNREMDIYKTILSKLIKKLTHG